MILEIEITRKDYADFSKFHFVKNKILPVFFIGALACIGLVYGISSDSETSWAELFYTFLLFVAFYSILMYLVLLCTRWIPKKNGSILGRRELTLNDEGINCKTQNSTVSSTWTGVKSFKKGRTAFYIYIDTNMAYLIPKRYFATEDEQQNFIKFVEAKIIEARR